MLAKRVDSMLDIGKPIIKIATSSVGKEQLFKELSVINSTGSTVQVFDPKAIINRIHVLGAYLNAKEAFSSKSNVSNSIAVEMLLISAMTRQISEAVERTGAKSGEFLLFANDKDAYGKAKKLIKDEREFEPSEGHIRSVAKKYGIVQENDMDQFVLQKMAIARLDS